jgi:general secretion pathway protein H
MVEGTTRIRFARRGYTQKSAIHLSSEDGRELTLVLSPFLGKVKVVNQYVDFD